LSPETIRDLALFFPPWLFALSIHEFSHAWVAHRLGDPTPQRQGRLTLSPLSHIDLLGSILLPALGLAFGGFFFGWAKPVMVQPRNFNRNRSRWANHLLVALAGPGSNLVLAILSAFLFVGLMLAGFDQGSFAVGAARWSLLANVLLAVFNMLPLPPLDGSRLIPDSMAELRDTLTRYAPMIFIALILPLFGGRSILGLVVAPVTQGLAVGLISVAVAVLG
jgi:Zn-dependent protease